MTTFAMTCSCGETMSLDASSRDEAVGMFKAGMTQEALDDHMRQYHRANEQKPTLLEAHSLIEQMVAAS